MAQLVKNLPAVWETWVRSLGWEEPLEEGMDSHLYSYLENPHEQRNLVGYSPWDHEELDMTEQLTDKIMEAHLLALLVYGEPSINVIDLSAWS